MASDPRPGEEGQAQNSNLRGGGGGERHGCVGSHEAGDPPPPYLEGKGKLKTAMGGGGETWVRSQSCGK